MTNALVSLFFVRSLNVLTLQRFLSVCLLYAFTPFHRGKTLTEHGKAHDLFVVRMLHVITLLYKDLPPVCLLYPLTPFPQGKNP